MRWKIFKINFRIISLLHIGYYKVGLLQRTRYYVMGKHLWAGLTARIAPELAKDLSSEELPYKKVGDFLKKNLIFSYFFLQDKDQEYRPVFKEKEGLKYGDIPLYEFEKRFITSIPSTAIEPNRLSAEDNTLHEIEVINRSRNNTSDPVPLSLTGYVFVKEEKEDSLHITIKDSSIYLNNVDIKEVLKTGIFVGGERRYGLGYIKLKDDIGEEQDKRFILNSDYPVRVYNNEPIDAHLKVSENLSLKGEIEMVGGREWRDSGKDKENTNKIGSGESIKSYGPFWMPGSIIREGKVRVKEWGMLEDDGC